MILCCAFLMISLITTPRSVARTQATGFLDCTVSHQGATYKYQVLVPENWSPKQKWPLILFLHGYGERCDDGLLQTDAGLAHAIRQNRSRFPPLVVLPQCSMGRWWTQPGMEDLALAAHVAASKEFKGDPKRAYLTGLSMGGYATWELASPHPRKFAVVVPICGGIVPPQSILKDFPELAKDAYPDDPNSYAEVARKIGRTPVWIFHGGADDAVPVENSR